MLNFNFYQDGMESLRFTFFSFLNAAILRYQSNATRGNCLSTLKFQETRFDKARRNVKLRREGMHTNI